MRAATSAGSGIQCSAALEKTASNSPLNSEIARIGENEFEFRIIQARLRDHRGRRVESYGFGAALGDLRGQMAGAAAQIEYALAWPRIEQVDQVSGFFPDEGMPVVVKSAIPTIGHQRPVATAK